ncbi:hypothetical protein JY651_45730 [Pyxidicoccus parkwayensis]|uniref:Outer membrane protein beta-barrel domain-containing protein n=1 Tax=Pyxidicoccus parkwayensis TaxID=2813578 RepID=A0ABX7NV53_9BACT|nr:hypothetical protein [Pyxidicoccus parkwaysis]QSQ22348.1 hypothetical protein JY651_45730 [Pyxidicoccus parkwaysis]
MKAKILAGAVAALMYGTAASAAGGDCPPPRASADSASHGVMLAQAQDEQPVQGDVQEEDTVIETEPAPGAAGSAQDPLLNEGVGGSGTAGQQDVNQQGVNQQDLGQQNEGIGGSGKQGEMLLKCQPVNQGTGGSGAIEAPAPAPAPSQQELTPPPSEQLPPPSSQEVTPPSQSETYPQQNATGGSGISQAPTPPPEYAPSAAAAEPIQPLETEKKKEKNDMRGLSLMVGGGVEGYTGALAPQISPGATAGVTAAIRPSKVFGVELGYSGALNNVKVGGSSEGVTSGPDLVRNGGTAVATLGLMATSWQPYVLGGIGISDYNFRGGEALGYRDDTVGSVPAGVGLRGAVGHFTVDARANYNFLFDKEFAPGVASGGGDFENGGSYQGTVSVGGTF